MTRYTGLALLAATFLGAGTAHAQSIDELAGVWKRPAQGEGSQDRYLHLQVDGSGALTGPMVNPPLAEFGVGCSVLLRLEGDKVVGAATWTEKQWTEQAKWEFTVASPDLLHGRSEWLDWEQGKVWERGWDQHDLVRVPRAGWITEGEAEAPFGDEVETLSALEGGWLGPHGQGWALAVDGDRVTLSRQTGEAGPASIPLVHERGTFRGAVQVGETESRVELVYDAAEGALVGRCSWSAGPVEGWAPVQFARLTRAEAGPAAAVLPAPNAAAPHGVWKRDDDLFLRLRPEGDEVVGELVERSGAVQARLRLALQDGVWTGPANWGSYETTWQLSLSKETLVGRAEWVDLHEGQVVARGWGGWSFTPLRRVQ